jgi:hypothetical protein
MSKADKTAFWIKPYPELVMNGDQIFCRACNKPVSSQRKSLVDQHVKTFLHISKSDKSKRANYFQETLAQYFSPSSKPSEQEEFNKELCKALISSNIPLTKVNNVNLKSFLRRFCKQSVPDEDTLRKNYVNSCYKETMSQIRQIVGSNFTYIIVDESTDKCGRYIAHLLIGILHEDILGRSYLISSKQLPNKNYSTIVPFVQEGLSRFFLPDSVPCEKIFLMLSDASLYMTKVGQHLKTYYKNITHVTCLAHGLNRVAEDIKGQFPKVTHLINNVNKVFLKSPLSVQLYMEQLPNVPLPPDPSRSGTWLEAAIFYADNFERIKNVILQITDSSTALDTCKILVRSIELPQYLRNIKSKYGLVSNLIHKLETQRMTLSESIKIIDTFDRLCIIDDSIRQKFNDVIHKNNGYQYLKRMNQLNFSVKFKNAPITFVGVERSFSIDEHIFSDSRNNFLLENFEQLLIINYFRNSS